MKHVCAPKTQNGSIHKEPPTVRTAKSLPACAPTVKRRPTRTSSASPRSVFAVGPPGVNSRPACEKSDVSSAPPSESVLRLGAQRSCSRRSR